ncbi:MAG: AAA family ATPase [Candidatus Methanofastidiosia archaeon]|jgi:BioD-like phosphotransacetylase family protein
MSLVITATKKNAGKTMVGIGIGLHHPGSIAFFKPLGTNLVNGKDEDVLLYKEIFNLKEDTELFNLSQDYHRIIHDLDETNIQAALKNRFLTLSEGKDFLIIESAHTISYGSYTGLSAPQIAAQLNIPGIVIAEGDPEKIIDKSLIAQRCFNVKNASLLGVIINKVTTPVDNVVEHLEEFNIPVLGVIPENNELQTPSCEDVIDTLDGELIAGKGGICEKVGPTIVGAMTYDTAQRIVHQIELSSDSIMVTGGTRADIQLLAFEIESSMLVLTGNVYPSMSILSKADELNVPVVMVPYDTMTAASRCEQAVATLSPEDAPLIKEIVGKNVDVNRILEAAG